MILYVYIIYYDVIRHIDCVSRYILFRSPYDVAMLIISGGECERWSVASFRCFGYALGRTGTTACDWSV